MAPPTIPSPHRFLSGNRKPHHQQAKETKPPSNLRQQVQERPSSDEVSPSASTSQFAPTPRFSFRKPPAAPKSEPSKSPPKPSILQAAARRTDQIDDSRKDGDDDEMLDDGQSSAPYIAPDSVSDTSAWTNDLTISPKRRRLDDMSKMTSPARPQFKAPATPASRSAPNFSFTSSRATPIPESHDAVDPRRTPFLRPPVEPQEPSEPLPEAFSPHRKGQKFVPGGMAATLQQWVVETGSSAVQSRRGQSYLRGEDYVMRIQVDEMKGHGPSTVRGRQSNGDPVDALLVGVGSRVGAGSKELMSGVIIGLRAPTWTIEIDGRDYVVGVDWRVT